MNTTKTLTLLFLLSVSISFSQIKQSIEDTTTPNSHVKFKIDGKNKTDNNFEISGKKVNLLIPLPNRSLRIKKVYNISSEKKNAILVVIDGNNGKPTGTEINGLLRCKIPFGRIKGEKFNQDSLKTNKKMVVYVIHDDEVTDCLIDVFKGCVSTNSEYRFNICNLEDECIDDKKRFLPQPREQDGDVIGGNE